MARTGSDLMEVTSMIRLPGRINGATCRMTSTVFSMVTLTRTISLLFTSAIISWAKRTPSLSATSTLPLGPQTATS